MKNKHLKSILFLTFMSLFISKVGYSQSNYGITVFGTDKITKDNIVKKYTSKLKSLVDLYNTDRDKYYKTKEALEKVIITLGDFSYSNIKLFKSYNDKYDFIIDFVDTKDSSKRLNYRKINTKKFSDPNGLIAKWIEYEDLSYKLFRDGEIKDYSCPVAHCLWSFNHPKLTPYLEYFNKLTPKNKEVLIQILNTSDSANYRASSAFLLAHSKMSNKNILEALMPSTHDSESTVRNNSMRVIYYIARANPEIKFNVSKIINALDFPSFTDRNKALVILRSIPLDNLKKEDAKRLANILIEVLEKKDAHNFRNAHMVIKKWSQKDYAVDDIESWKKWTESSF